MRWIVCLRLGSRSWAADRFTATLRSFRPRCCQRRISRQAAFSVQRADLVDQIGIFEDRDEAGGRDHAGFRMPPAQQRFRADHALGKVDDRLKGHFELLAVDRVAQVLLEREAFPRDVADLAGRRIGAPVRAGPGEARPEHG